VDLVHQHKVAAGVDKDLTDRVGDVGGVDAGLDRWQTEKSGELRGQLAWGALRRGSDIDDRDAILAGKTLPDHQLVGLSVVSSVKTTIRLILVGSQ